MQEPSVLDYVKSLLMPWKKPRITLKGIPQAESGPAVEAEPQAPLFQDMEAGGPLASDLARADAKPAVIPARGALFSRLPWRLLVTLSLALLAQLLLEPRQNRMVWPAVFLYLLSAGWLVWAHLRGEWLAVEPAEDGGPPELKEHPEAMPATDPWTVRRTPLILTLISLPLAFLTLRGDRFTFLNVSLWGILVVVSLRAFWLSSPAPLAWREKLKSFIRKPEIKFRLGKELLVSAGIVALVLFFRLYQLNQVPLEMTSDHAEKLLDVWDVLHGQYPIFFIRNTGRELFQFYWTAALVKLLGTGITFLSLKLGTAIAGLVTLLFIYLIGKELGNREMGMLAALLAGIAAWPNLITRIGLRFTFYPAFTAITLYFLLRGLRRLSRNDCILAGLALGIGLHTYTPIRVLPLVVLAAFLLFAIHLRPKNARRQAILWLCITFFIAFVVFLPLLRYSMEYPDYFFYRTITRIGTLEQPLPGPAWQIFLKNTWNALVMFFWDNGEIWTISIPHRPALDFVSAALFWLGICLVAVRYLRRRSWTDLFLLVSIPLLMLPSILSLAFPNENPAVNRTAGAIVPVFLIIGIALQGLLAGIRKQLGPGTGQRWAWGVGLALIAISVVQNYQLVFIKYRQLYDQASWNTSEVGHVIRNFADSIGSLDSAWVVPYPYWLDTRLVGMNAGLPTKDYALAPDQLGSTLGDPRAKLFIFKMDDQQTLYNLIDLYPQGRLKLYQSRIPTKEFWTFTVLPEKNPDLVQPDKRP